MIESASEKVSSTNIEMKEIGQQSAAVPPVVVTAEKQSDEAVLAARLYAAGSALKWRDPEKVKFFLRAAELNNADAQCMLGHMYQFRRIDFGVDRNDGEAVRWLRRAVDQNHPEAKSRLTKMYRDNRVPFNLEKLQDYRDDLEKRHILEVQAYLDRIAHTAERLYKDATRFILNPISLKEVNPALAAIAFRAPAELNHPAAQFHLGSLYKSGEGVEQDFAEAEKWLRRAAEQNHERAQNNLGCMYSGGEGVTQDYAEAVKWYRREADQYLERGKVQYSTGRDNLAKMYQYNEVPFDLQNVQDYREDFARRQIPEAEKYVKQCEYIQGLGEIEACIQKNVNCHDVIHRLQNLKKCIEKFREVFEEESRFNHYQQFAIHALLDYVAEIDLKDQAAFDKKWRTLKQLMGEFELTDAQQQQMLHTLVARVSTEENVPSLVLSYVSRLTQLYKLAGDALQEKCDQQKEVGAASLAESLDKAADLNSVITILNEWIRLHPGERWTEAAIKSVGKHIDKHEFKNIGPFKVANDEPVFLGLERLYAEMIKFSQPDVRPAVENPVAAPGTAAVVVRQGSPVFSSVPRAVSPERPAPAPLETRKRIPMKKAATE